MKGNGNLLSLQCIYIYIYLYNIYNATVADTNILLMMGILKVYMCIYRLNKVSNIYIYICIHIYAYTCIYIYVYIIYMYV
jgi:hypothetical protein